MFPHSIGTYVLVASDTPIGLVLEKPQAIEEYQHNRYRNKPSYRKYEEFAVPCGETVAQEPSYEYRHGQRAYRHQIARCDFGKNVKRIRH